MLRNFLSVGLLCTAFWGFSPVKFSLRWPWSRSLPISVSNSCVTSDANNKHVEKFYQTKWGSFKRFFLKRRIVSKSVGTFFDMSLSRPYIQRFLKHYPHIVQHADEFEMPIGGITAFDSFNNFFHRRLSSKGWTVRPIDKSSCVVTSPADGHLFVVQDLSTNPDFYVKGCSFNLEKFLNDHELAQEYNDGSLLLFRLAPDDYHRFHFPFDCTLSRPRPIKGYFESVSPSAYTPTALDSLSCDVDLYRAGIQPLTENERHVIILESEVFGKVVCVVVGAMMVGQIHYTYLDSYEPRKHFKKGQEMGYFAFGASTIVLIFKRNTITVADTFVAASAAHAIPLYKDIYHKHAKNQAVHYPELPLKMGEKVAKRISIN